MSLWSAILLAALICLALKAAGYLVPPKVLEAPRTARISDLLTVALLAARGPRCALLPYGGVCRNMCGTGERRWSS